MQRTVVNVKGNLCNEKKTAETVYVDGYGSKAEDAFKNLETYDSRAE